MNNSKISIITCTLNSGEFLQSCIESVKNQNYSFIEHVFVDGGSTDKTIEIIKNFYDNPIIVNRKANGIYDALNYGLEIASGDIIGFLHSDDIFFDDQCLVRIAQSFARGNNIAYYCSRMFIHDAQLKNCFAVLGAPPHRASFREQLYSSTYYAHPTYYCRKDIIRKVGNYNTDYKVAADIDWLMRLEKLNLQYFFDSKPLIKFRSTGKSAKNYFLALIEEFKIRKKYEGLNFCLIVIYFYHFLRRLVRYILEIFGLNKLIARSRSLIIKLNKENIT